MPTAQAVTQCTNLAKTQLMGSHTGVHLVYEGIKEVNGQLTGEPCVVCVVEKKVADPQSQGLVAIPSRFFSGSENVTVDIQEAPKVKIQRLILDTRLYSSFHPYNQQQQCNDPVMGGDQISPVGSNWVGTLSCSVLFGGYYGFLTNHHVGVVGSGTKGAKIAQPNPSSQHIGELYDWEPIKFGGRVNYIDTSIFTCRQYGGKSVVVAQQRDLGDLSSELVVLKVGDQVAKSGRTTGVIENGQVVGINASVNVGYDAGQVAVFDDQVVIKRIGGGEFSGPGDSGSLIVIKTGNVCQPGALLFAGSTGMTIANRIQRVVDRYQCQFK